MYEIYRIWKFSLLSGFFFLWIQNFSNKQFFSFNLETIYLHLRFGCKRFVADDRFIFKQQLKWFNSYLGKGTNKGKELFSPMVIQGCLTLFGNVRALAWMKGVRGIGRIFLLACNLHPYVCLPWGLQIVSAKSQQHYAFITLQSVWSELL